MRRAFAAAVNFLIAVITLWCWISILIAVTDMGSPLMAGGLYSLKFFTTLSNLFNGAACAATCIVLMLGKTPSQGLRTWKLAGTAAVGLTFLTVMVFLGPVFGYGGMFLGTNFWYHLTLPVVSMLSFVTLERDTMLPFGKTLWAVVPMLLYSAGYLGNVLIQGPGEWPNRHDFYGFLLWGWPIGIAIACGLVVLIWVLAVVLRRLNGKKIV